MIINKNLFLYIYSRKENEFVQQTNATPTAYEANDPAIQQKATAALKIIALPPFIKRNELMLRNVIQRNTEPILYKRVIRIEK